MSDIMKQLLLQLVLILLNAFFAATEIAVISLNEKKVRAQAEGGKKRAKILLKIIQEPTQFHHPDRHYTGGLSRIGICGG